MTKILIGTSGWSYGHWYGRFYPEDIPSRDTLKFYSETFDTVEVNSTFYRIPYENMVKGWYKKTPKDFVFALKAPRLITHVKKLTNAEQPLGWFLERADFLKEKLGPVLFQVPPSMKRNTEKLEGFLSILPEIDAAFEFRNESWNSDDVYAMLEKYNVAYCITSAPKLPTVLKTTSDIAYIRFHGIHGWYDYNYTDEDLRWWGERIKELEDSAEKIFAYFNNDFECFAVENAKKLIEKLKH